MKEKEDRKNVIFDKKEKWIRNKRLIKEQKLLGENGFFIEIEKFISTSFSTAFGRIKTEIADVSLKPMDAR